MRNQQPQTDADTVCFFSHVCLEKLWPLVILQSIHIFTQILLQICPNHVRYVFPKLLLMFSHFLSQSFPVFLWFPHFESLMFATPREKEVDFVWMKLSPKKRKRKQAQIKFKHGELNHVQPLENAGNTYHLKWCTWSWNNEQKHIQCGIYCGWFRNPAPPKGCLKPDR